MSRAHSVAICNPCIIWHAARSVRRRGTEREDRALYWYRRSAEGGNGDAMCNLGRCYERGYGVEQNWQEAVKWYEQGAQCGHFGNP